MIEIIYKNNNTESMENTTLKLPKNIRQIGHGDSDYQIYIEDYLMSYLKKRPEKEGDIRYGILLGDVKLGNGYTYFFINGAVDVEDVLENTIIFNDEIWTGLYEDINSYFMGNRVVGWFAALNESSNNDMVNIKKIHLDNFAGTDKLFLKLDMDEDDESFYIYENTGMTKQPCYHIYFNKSEYMEDYIFGTGKKDRFKKPEVKEAGNGKYGILLNNINQKKALAIKDEKQSEVVNEAATFNFGGVMRFARVAVITAAVFLIAGVGMLYKDGKLGSIKQGIEDFAVGIFSDDEKNMEDIISVNGSVYSDSTSFKELETEGATTTQAASQETTTGEQPSEEETTTEAETLETVMDVTETYVVKEGDTLLSICIDFYQDKSMLDDVIAANNIENPDIVIPGQELIMP